METIYCGLINESNINQTITANGWVKKIRKLGNLLFIDIADRYGLLQIIAHQDNASFITASKLTRESVIQVTGKIIARKSPNLNIPTGKIEMNLETLTIHSVAEITPLIIETKTDANEDTRMRYRYLDLRRANIQQQLIFRSKFINACREYLNKLDFVEVETPILGRATPEGARDYLVPTRNGRNRFFALPQSAQTFKQLLMVAGMLKYYQIAKCFRDEDLRADRQPEFTQLDMELSFVNENDIQNLIENMLRSIFKSLLKVNLPEKFPILTFDEAMNSYGSDKPDLRFDLKLQLANPYFKSTKFKIFANTIKQQQAVKYILIDNQHLSKKEVNQLEKFAKDNGAFGLAWLTYENNQMTNGSINKIIENESIQAIARDNHSTKGTILFVAGNVAMVNQALGAVRFQLGSLLNLKDPKVFKFVWIVEWPLFEYNDDEKRYVAAHHPFTQPQEAFIKTFDKDLKSAKARAYDLVLNGSEIAGGSIRISDLTLQHRMFKAIGLTPQEYETKFGALLNAFKYGVPPHGGIAFGLDRLLMVILNTNSIRDVIAFPKNSTGVDLMMDAPGAVDPKDLIDLNIKLSDK